MSLSKCKRGYHSDNHGHQVYWKRGFEENGIFHGIELEVESESEDYTDIMDIMPDHDEDKEDQPAPVFEEDGSLDEDAGIEIIFPPISPSQIRAGNGYFRKAIKALDKSGLVRCNSNTGMHFNVNCRDWNGYKKGLFVGLLHMMPVRMLETVGGRRLNGYCSQDKQPLHTTAYYSERPGDCHGYAAEHKNGGNRIECRFPWATVDLTKIAFISSFLEAVEYFAEAHDGKWYDTQELGFLASEWFAEHNNKEYQEYASFFK